MNALRRSADVRELGVIAASALAMFAIFLVVRGSLIDDAYITLAYARNLALHLHWGIIPQEVSNTATSPLNVALLGALTAVTRVGGGVHPVMALGIESVGLAALMAWGWTRLVRAFRLPLVVAALGVAVVLVNPFVLSSIGLEVLLMPTLLVLLLVAAVEDRPKLFGVLAGLSLLARLDLVVFVLAIAVASPAIRRGRRRAAGCAVATAAPWFVFSWFALGSAIPDTLLIKTAQADLFTPWTYATGPVMYFVVRDTAVLLALLPAVLGLFAFGVWLAARLSVRPEAAPRLPSLGTAAAVAAGGLAYFVIYRVLRVPPYHWYYNAPIVSLAMFGVLAVGVWWQRARAEPLLRPAVPAAVLAGVALVVVASLARDLQQGVPWREPVITTNFATSDAYADIGVELRRRVGDATVQNQGEIGALAYFCECVVVEGFSERGRLMPLIDARIDGGGPGRLLYRLNYLWLDRDERPRPHQYTLVHGFGPPPRPGPGVWSLRSPWSGPNHLVLTKVP